MIRRLFRYSTRYLKIILLSSISSVITVLLAAVTPFIMRRLIDDVITEMEWEMFLPYFALLVVVEIARSAGSVVMNYGDMKVGLLVTKDVQMDLYKAALHSPSGTIERSGDFISLLTYDVPEFTVGVLIVYGLIFQGAYFTVHSIVLFKLNPQLFLVVCAFIPLYWISLHYFTKSLSASSHSEKEMHGRFTDSIREKTEGISTIKRFGKREEFLKRFEEDITSWIAPAKKLRKTQLVLNNITALITSLVPILALGVGVYFVYAGSTTLGSVIAFFSYVPYLFEPVRNGSQIISEYAVVKGPAERVFSLLDAEREPERGDLVLNGEIVRISFQDVSFSYGSQEVLHGIDLDLDLGAHRNIGVVGRTGSGKSTLMRLLADPKDHKGRITVNGAALEEYNPQHLGIMLVSVDDFLFHTTIKENITLGDPFSDDEVALVLSQVCLDMDMSTLLGEGGTKISQGEKQRIALARALIRKPKLLILDEATNAVDATTEQRIYENMREIPKIVVSHRLSTIMNMDRIILIDSGAVIASGTYSELMKNREYAELFKYQLIREQ